MQMISDGEGSVTFGWATPGVYYTRFTGNLSAQLGASHLHALQEAVERVSNLRYFSDSSELTSYDLLARSAFFRLLVSNRKKFSDVVILNWAGGLSAVGRALSSSFGQPLLILEERPEFERLLRLAAPLFAPATSPSKEIGRAPADVR